MKKSESLAKNLSLMVALNSQTLPCIKTPTKTLLELTQDRFVHCKKPNVLGISVSALGFSLSTTPLMAGTCTAG
jgi:hypothetical protein